MTLLEQSCDWQHERDYIATLPIDFIRKAMSGPASKWALCGGFAGELSAHLSTQSDLQRLIPTNPAALLSQPHCGDVKPIHPEALAELLSPTDNLVLTSPAYGRFLLDRPVLLAAVALKIKKLLLLPVVLEPQSIGVNWGAGFSGVESAGNASWCWCDNPGKTASFSMVNPFTSPISGTLSFEVTAIAAKKKCSLDINGPNGRMTISLKGSQQVKIPLTLVSGHTPFDFLWHGPVIQPEPGARHLSFAVNNLQFTDSSGVVLFTCAKNETASGYSESLARTTLHKAGFSEIGGLLCGKIPGPPVQLMRSREGRGHTPYYPIQAGDSLTNPYRQSPFDVTWLMAYRLPQQITLPEVAA